MNIEKNSLEKNIEEIKEWQDHQYIPGYWLGGKIPKYEFRNTTKLGILYLIIGFVGLILNILFFSFLDIGQRILSILFTLLMLRVGYIKLKSK